jgi:hypothetical protein
MTGQSFRDLVKLRQSDEVYLLHWGLVHYIVCAPAALAVSEVERITNEKWPTGIESRWTLTPLDICPKVPDHAWCGTNTLDCPDDAKRKHYLLVC